MYWHGACRNVARHWIGERGEMQQGFSPQEIDFWEVVRKSTRFCRLDSVGFPSVTVKQW